MGDKLELDLKDEVRRSRRLSDELDIAKGHLDEIRKRLDQTMSREKLATDALMQCYKDLRYAVRCFGQHDWLERAFLESCDKLKLLGIEVSRSVDAG